MISVIICSIDSRKFQAVEAMYAAAMGPEPWELIGVHDAKSAAEGYQRGFDQSHGDIVVFSHDDIEILSPDFPRRLTGHLAVYDIIGVAGTSRAVSACWSRIGPPYLLGQMVHPGPDGTFNVDIFGAPARVSPAQTVDGVFVAVRRAVMSQIHFDAVTFDGFHLWDQDFCLSACQAGLKVGVANDINLLHHSTGKFDDVWRHYGVLFEKKWRDWLARMRPGYLPLAIGWDCVRVDSLAAVRQVLTPPHW
jgi:hypothetical protein